MKPRVESLFFLFFLLSSCAPNSTPAQKSAAQDIAVGRDVQVSTKWWQTEHTADADPSNPAQLMVCVQAYDPGIDRRRTGIYVSADGGKTWAYRAETVASDNGDPACIYTLRSAALFATLSIPPEPPNPKSLWETWPKEAHYPSRMNLYRSSDAGRTWNKPIGLGMIDHENILIDRTGGRYQGRIYIHGNVMDRTDKAEGNKLWVVYSTDGGRTFVRSAATPVKGDWTQWDKGAILPDGTLLVPYVKTDNQMAEPDKQQTTVAVSSSTDGGVHLSALRPVGMPLALCSSTLIAADNTHGAFRGRAYLLYGKWDVDYFGHLPSQCALMIVFSDDRGKTWSQPVDLSDAMRAPGGEAVSVTRPAIAVNDRGAVAASWEDTRGDPNAVNGYRYFTASLDGGDTWLPNVRVSRHAFARRGLEGDSIFADAFGPGSPMSSKSEGKIHTMIGAGIRVENGGDYGTSLVADPDGIFHLFWAENGGRVGGMPELHTAPITVRGHVSRNGSPLLAGLHDVTSKIDLQYQSTASSWSSDAATLMLRYVLHNTSKSVVRGPLRMRLTAIESSFGKASVILPNGKLGGAGTVVDLTPYLPAKGLKAGARSSPATIRIRITSLNQAVIKNKDSDLASLDAKVFAAR